MKTTMIPGFDKPLSSLCLGCAYLGSRENDELSMQIMDTYFENGGRFFNTAHEYGDNGSSEILLGRWARERGVRDQILVTSKGGEDDSAPDHDCRHMRYDEVLEDIDEGLMRTGFDYFDFYMLHMDDRRVPVDEILAAMEKAKADGKIRHYGCSNWDIDRMEAAAAYSKEHGLEGFMIDEIEFNMAKNNVANDEPDNPSRWMDRSYIEYHKKTNMAYAAYTPIVYGNLTKLLRDGDTRNWKKNTVFRFDNPYTRESARRIGIVAEQLGVSPTALQLAWVTSAPYGFPGFAIVGCSKVEQLTECLTASDIVIPEESIRWLSMEDYED